MGKSLKNGVSPDDIYEAYGADTLRLYEMAMGPLDGDRPWRTDDIVGMHRFLQRLWRLVVDETTGETLPTGSDPASEAVLDPPPRGCCTGRSGRSARTSPRCGSTPRSPG